MKFYELDLPVFKQGDDLGHQIQQSGGDLRLALETQASMYDEAARLCRRMAGAAAEIPDLTIDADTHHIGVSGPIERLESLVNEGVLSVMEHEDEEDEEDEGNLDEDYEGEDGEDLEPSP